MDERLAERMTAKLMSDHAPQDLIINNSDALRLVTLLRLASRAPMIHEPLSKAFYDLGDEMADVLAKRKGKRARDVWAALDAQDMNAVITFIQPMRPVTFRLSIRKLYLILQAVQLSIANFADMMPDPETEQALGMEFQRGILVAYPAAKDLLEAGWDRSQDYVEGDHAD